MYTQTSHPFLLTSPKLAVVFSQTLSYLFSYSLVVSRGSSLSSRGQSVLLWSSVFTLFRRASVTPPSPPSDFYFRSHVPSLRELFQVTPQMVEPTATTTTHALGKSRTQTLVCSYCRNLRRYEIAFRHIGLAQSNFWDKQHHLREEAGDHLRANKTAKRVVGLDKQAGKHRRSSDSKPSDSKQTDDQCANKDSKGLRQVHLKRR